MILSAQSIRIRCLRRALRPAMVWPFHEREKAFGMSYGLSAAGYDIRVAQELMLARGQFAIASSIERFHMPRDVLGTVKDKSTWARQGLSVYNTVIEPGWSGFLTLELVNHGPRQITLVPGMPVAQILFQLLDAPTEEPYRGKYDNQPARPVGAILESAA
jgi:dCTP deaminase